MFRQVLSYFSYQGKFSSSIGRNSRRSKRQRERCRLRHEALERRELMAADLIGVVRGANQYLLNTDTDSAHEIDVNYGLSGDSHVTGNWTGNGVDYPGVVRGGSADGLLRWYLDTDGDPTHELSYAYGLNGDTPVVGNWDGVGGDNIGVVRGGGDGLLHWYLDTDGDPTHELEYIFGLNGDTPVTGDWNGDGRTDVGVVRVGSDGLLHWYLNTDNDVWQEDEYAFGLPGDMPVVGDWDRDGRDDVGVVRSESNGLLRWYANTDRDIYAESTFDYGLRGDRPIVGQWKLPEVRLSGSDLVGQTLNFGTVYLNATMPTQRVTITNDGNTTLTLRNFSAPSGFQLLSTPPSQLLPNTSTTLTIGMRTSTAASYSNNLTFNTNDGNEATVAIALRGTVRSEPTPTLYPEIDIAGVVHGQSTPIDLGVSPLNGQLSRTFTVRNTGAAALTISRPTSVPNGFELDWNVPSSLSPNTNGTFTIRVNTNSAGIKTGNFSIPNNDRDEGPFVFGLKATVQATATRPEIELVGASHGQTVPFGSVLKGSTPVTRSFTIRNTGNGPLTVARPSNVNGFTIGWSVPNTIQPGASHSFTVSLNTATAGSFSGNIVINSNDADEGRIQFGVAGTVVNPTPEIDIVGVTDGVGTTDIGSGYVGATVARTFTIRNLGTAPLTVQSVSTPSGFNVTGMPSQLAPNASAQFTVSANTSNAGTLGGWLRIRTNDADESTFDISLRAQVFALPTSNYGTVLSFQSVISSSGIMVVKHVRTYGGTGNNERIFADFYSSNGTLLRHDQSIGDHSLAGLHQQVTATALSNGSFAIGWVLKKYGGETEIRYGVMDAYGRSVGAADRQANIAFSQSLTSPSIVATSVGFDIRWRNTSSNTNWRRSFNFQGTALSGELRI